MDKLQKFEFMKSIEDYLEDNQVYELFESLLKQLVINRPEQPLDFLIQKLSKPEGKQHSKTRPHPAAGKRIFLVAPPGTNRKETSLALAEYFNWTCISVGDLLNKEVSKKSDYGKRIQESRKFLRYIDDEIVIDLVKRQVATLEKEGKSWIIEGFPRTKVQALSLQKIGVIPDKFIILKNKEQVVYQ